MNGFTINGWTKILENISICEKDNQSVKCVKNHEQEKKLSWPDQIIHMIDFELDNSNLLHRKCLATKL